MKFVKENFVHDIRYYYLLPQLEIFKVLMKGGKIESFSDILIEVKNLVLHQGAMIIERVLQMCKLLNANPATAVTGQR